MEIKALVPVMTSNTTPEGECGASSVYSGFPAYYAFNGTSYDRTISGRYWSAADEGTEEYIYYKFTSPKLVTNFKFKASEASGTADNNTTCVLIVSDDGETWTDIQTYNIVAKAVQTGVLYELNIDESKQGKHLYYGVKFPSWPQGKANVGELQFYKTEHSKSIGDIYAIRDWLNASIYNKEEIEDLFIQNDSGLQAYELTLKGFGPEVYLRLIGQTSGKVYNVYTNEISGDFWGLFWFATGETIDIVDVETGITLKSKALTKYKMTIMKYGVYADFFKTGSKNTPQIIVTPFDPEISMWRQGPSNNGNTMQDLNYAIPTLGASIGNGVADQDALYPNMIVHIDGGIQFTPKTDGWSSRTCMFTMYESEDYGIVITSPAVGETIDIDLEFKPMSIVIRPTSEEKRFYVYDERYLAQTFFNGEGSCNATEGSSPITNINDNGFTFLSRNATQAGKEYRIFAAPYDYDGYKCDSQWFTAGLGTFTSYNGRSYNKTNPGPAYVAAAYNGSSTTPQLISKDQNFIKTNNPSFEHEFEYDGETYWTGGNQYGFSGNYTAARRYIDISEYSPFSTSSDQNYKLPCIQKAVAMLNIILGKDVPIPQSL